MLRLEGIDAFRQYEKLWHPARDLHLMRFWNFRNFLYSFFLWKKIQNIFYCIRDVEMIKIQGLWVEDDKKIIKNRKSKISEKLQGECYAPPLLDLKSSMGALSEHFFKETRSTKMIQTEVVELKNNGKIFERWNTSDLKKIVFQ